MSSLHSAQSPLTTSTLAATGEAFATETPFSNSIEAIRARLQNAVRNIDNIVGAAQRAPSPSAFRSAAAGADVSSPRVDRWEVKDPGDGRRLHGGPTSCAAALALLRARQESAAPRSAEAGTLPACQSSSTPHSDQVSKGSPTPGPSVATPFTASYSRESASTASAATEAGTVLSATYAAALDFWRVHGRRTYRPAPMAQAGLTAAPLADAALASAAASTVSPAPVAGAHNAHTAASITFAPPPYSKGQRSAANTNFAERAHTNTDILADTAVEPARLFNTLSTAAATATAQTDHRAIFAPLSWPPGAALPTSLAATTPSTTRSRSLTPDCSRTRHTQPPRALADDSYFSTTAPAPLPLPSSVTTLSARLAALRAADTAQCSSMLAQQRQRQEWPHDEKRHVSSGTSALATHATVPLADYGVRAHRGTEASTSEYFDTNTAPVHHRQKRAEPQHLPQSSVAVDTSSTNATSDHNWLVCSPSSKPATSPTAKTRQAQRASRRDETSFIVSLAQDMQAAREEAWRDAQDSVKLEPPVRPPPLPPLDTSGLARYTPPSRLPEQRGGGIVNKPLCALATTADTRSGTAVATASSRALTSSTAPLDALQAGLLPSAIVMAAVGGGAAGNESLPMHEELAMRERLAARRQRQSEHALVVHDGAAEHQRQRYERLSDVRDRDVAEHLRGETARQTAVQVAAQARVAQVRAALPDQPEAVTSDELVAIRLHAQQLERMREQTQWMMGRSPSLHVGAAPAPAVDAVSTTDSSSLLIPAATSGKACGIAAAQRGRIKEEVSTPAQQTRTAAGKEKHPHNPSEKVVATAAATRTRYSDATIDPSVVAGDGLRSAGAPSASTPITAAAEREATPEQTMATHRACPSSSQDLVQRHAAGSCQHCSATPAHATGQVAGEAVNETERSAGGSLDEDLLTSTQLPPPSSDVQVKAVRRAKTSAPSTVKLQRSASSPSASRADGVGTGKPTWAASVQPSISASSNAASSPIQRQNALTVSANDDAERDLISSPRSGRYSDRGGKATGSTAPDRIASIQSTHLYVSASRGTAWQDDSTASDASSSSSSRLPVSVSPFRALRSASGAGGSARPPVSRTRSPLYDGRVDSTRSASLHRCATLAGDGARRSGAGRTGSSALTSSCAATSPTLRSKATDPLQAHRRAVQHEVDKRTALRAQAMLSEHGVAVHVQLVGHRVPSLVKLSKDEKELLFYLDRVEQVPLPTPRASPLTSLPASSAEFASRSSSPATVLSRLPGTGSAPATMSRVAQPSASSSPAAAQPPRFHPPRLPGAAASVAPSMQPHNGLVKTPPVDTFVKGKAIAGRGGVVVGAPPRGIAPSLSSPQQQRLVAAAPPLRGGAVPFPFPSPPPLTPHMAAATLLRRDVSPCAAASTLPIRVRELHHFPCSYSRVYVPFGVMGYESDLGLGGPGTWEDVGGILCGPASFEVLRRYRCPLFAEVRGPLCAPYRVYLIIPQFKRIDVPQDAVLLVLDFQQRIDWVLFLLAMQRDVADRGDCDIGVLADSSSLSDGAARSPVLSYGRALWMLAVQRLQRARALRGMNPFELDRMWPAHYLGQRESRGAARRSGRGAPSVAPSSLAKSMVYPLAGGAAATCGSDARPSTRSGRSRSAGPKARASSAERISVPPRGRNNSPARRRDPGVDLGWDVSAAAEGVTRGSRRGSGSRFWNPRQCTSPARPQTFSTSRAGAAVVPVTSQGASKPRFELLKRVSRSLGVSRHGKGS
ncbi:conserved hypothetical protein [Leishmania major strain Friedlin]|uniref:Uncharacterized protein n=1 Tax=Leishmania major TaxID=5664 RepID=Q4QE03_LEIMA|nr:conserved hypothetical protein [Leishmania major strain Friedlin]CAG9572422.1 hypothetical_protein_-_conserved [Leishmania major strain Friedlin]CAJ03553.1 conserved hypothetical protein [Leishmania major strain Friedlin]|eukprot:XP_001682445.1 conserved hypothetical protein [Leishmania major strain Friedlin]